MYYTLHYHYFIIICIHVLQADPVQELDASFDITREDAAPLGPALDASFDEPFRLPSISMDRLPPGRQDQQ